MQGRDGSFFSFQRTPYGRSLTGIMSYAFEKHYTLAEANALVPALRELFRRVHDLLDASDDAVAAPAGAGSNGSTNGNGNGNGHHGPKSAPTPPSDQRTEAANELLKSVAARGIVIQDWRRGLIDFPSIRDGEEVFLCYELADGPLVQYYHEISEGYAGRLPL